MEYIHPSLSARSYIAVSQLPRDAPRIEVRRSDPSTDRSIKIVPQLAQVFQPYRKKFRQLIGGGREAPPNTIK
jgi:hypothetical protein